MSRTLHDIGEFSLLEELKETIHIHLLPVLMGKCAFSDAKIQLISLPPHLGGLGINDPCVYSAFQFDASQRITSPLISLLPSGAKFTIYLAYQMSNWPLNRRYILRIVVLLRNWLLLYIPCYLPSCSMLEIWHV